MKQLILSLIICLGGIGMVEAHESITAPDHISVVGTGEVEQEPDQAILRISVSAKEPTMLEAKTEADRKYKNVLTVIKNAGIDDKLVKATRVMAQPQHEWQNNKQVYKGELVSRSLSILVEDLDKISPLMQALVEQGVSTIDGMETKFSNEAELQRKALGLAADDARAKAEFLAQRLGRKLGAAYLITEHNNPPKHHPQQNYGRMTMAADSRESAPPEMFGTQKSSATVNVSFYLL